MPKYSRPKQQHYVPQFYLRGFLGSKDRLYVVDRPTKRVFRVPTLKVGGEQNYNLVNSASVSPFAVEELYGEMEGDIAPALERIIAAKSLQIADDRALIMELISSIALRNPGTREGIGEIVEALTGEKATKELNIAIELDQQANLAQSLSRRRWQLIVATENSGGFVTSDDPVCLRWADGQPHGGLSPGFGVVGSEVIFPLSTRLAIRGRFDGEENVVGGDAATVGTINSLSISHARHQVYAHDSLFNYMRTPAEGLGCGAHLIDDKRFLDGGEQRDVNKVIALRTN